MRIEHGLMALVAMTPLLLIQQMNADVPCNSGIGPDVVIGDLPEVIYHGRVGDICAYSVATNIVNIGDADLAWFAGNNQHPAIAQHMYRMTEDRIEQIGLSWVKHGFGALAWNDFDCGCQDPGTFDYLGVGCTDPYTAGLNGDQDGFPGWGVAGLGPRWEINSTTGEFPFPYSTQGQAGDAIYKRLQVHADDLIPDLDEDVEYFIEGHYVTPDDAMAGNGANSLGYKPAVVTAYGDGWNVDPAGDASTCVPGLPAVYAWAEANDDVVLDTADDFDGNRLVLASRATKQADGSWRYEYALHNINLNRDVGNFGVPFGNNVTFGKMTMHRPDHHSGGPWTNEEWEPVIEPWGYVRFLSPSYEAAQHWGTLFNFTVYCNAPPVMGEARAQAAQAGHPNDYEFIALVPGDVVTCQGDLDGNGSVNVDDLLAVIGGWGDPYNVDDLLLVIGGWGPCP